MRRIYKNKLYAFIVFFSVMSACAENAPSLPATKPGQLLSEWLNLCNVADVDYMTKWGSEHMNGGFLERIGAEAFAKLQASDCAMNGGYRFVEVLNSQSESVSVLAAGNRTNAYVRMNVRLDPAGKVAGLGSMPVPPPESALPRDLSDKAVASDLGSYMEKLNRADEFSGIVMIARGDKPIFTRTAGYADRGKKTPLTPSSQFTLGSMGKMFTATAVGQLVDQGKISFDDVIGKFFPDFPNKTIREKATVGMLLSHTSGMNDFLDKRSAQMMTGGVKRAAEFMPLFDHDEPLFEPGKGWSYSNAGLALAGAIVEKVSGEDYPAYIRKHIFEVAGMKNSDPNNIPHRDERLVTPYTKSEGAGDQWREAEHDIGSPAGGAISTAEDLVLFANALRSGRLVSKSTFDKMTEEHGRAPWGGGYGYAMNIDNVYGRRVVGHGGGFPGVSTELYIVLSSPYTAVVLANQDPPAAERVGGNAKGFIAEKAKRNE